MQKITSKLSLDYIKKLKKPKKIFNKEVPYYGLDRVDVTNKISKKPKEGIKKLKQYIIDTDRCNDAAIGITQDYSKGVINMYLLSSYACCFKDLPGYRYFDNGVKIATPTRNSSGFIIFQEQQIPITSAPQKYIQALKEMDFKEFKKRKEIEKEREIEIERERFIETATPSKKSFMQKLKNCAKMSSKSVKLCKTEHPKHQYFT